MRTRNLIGKTNMSAESKILEKLIKIASNQQKVLTKLAQMGAGVKIRFVHPQYFAKYAEHLFKQFIKHSDVDIAIYDDRVSFGDGGGTLDNDELHQIATECCVALEQHLGADRGEIFVYNSTPESW